MNKDVIYIDVEDDITAIIGKVKASKEKVVALVPPKRIGVLQSAVNLRLLTRTAQQAGKHIALVTNNQALIALAASASIPVAKNLQTKPEMAEIPALKVDDDEEDIIEGATLPIGDHASQTPSEEGKREARSAAMADALAQAPKAGETPKPKTKSKIKVPNFNQFRKRFVLIIIGAVLLLAFGIWAIFFAARATVVIKAKTTSTSVNVPVTIASSATTSFEKSTLKAISKAKSEDKKIEFQATGKKDAGKKATGTINYENSSLSSRSVPAGTRLTASSGVVFVTDSEVSVSGATFPCGNISCPSPGTASGSVTAAENGSKYNGATGSVSGEPSNISGEFAGPTSGGVTKMVKIVTAGDVQKAKESLADEDSDSIRDDLKGQFGGDTTVVDESFNVGYKDVTSTPNIGEEADSATLEATVVYTLYGVEKSAVDDFLDAYLKDELKGDEGQRVYDNGAAKVVFQEASAAKNGAKATLIATAQIGPEIKDDDVKEQVRGKRYGETQEALESIKGVEDVDVKFFPFWVSTVPDDPKKITVEFNIDAK
jgi:hypothetical protein